jgi:hypothetical protein
MYRLYVHATLPTPVFWSFYRRSSLVYLGLSFTAEKLAMLNIGNVVTMDYLIIRTKAINLINKRLHKTDEATQDSTINCVAHLAMYEVCQSKQYETMKGRIQLTNDHQAANGRELAAKTHFMGLERMVTIRGGLKNTNMSAALQRIVLW